MEEADQRVRGVHLFISYPDFFEGRESKSL